MWMNQGTVIYYNEPYRVGSPLAKDTKYADLYPAEWIPMDADGKIKEALDESIKCH